MKDEVEQHKVKIQMKSLPYTPRGAGADYRSGSFQIVDSSEAYELRDAEIAIIIDDPYTAAPRNEVPYLQPEGEVIFDAQKPQKVDEDEDDEDFEDEELEEEEEESKGK